MSFTRRKLHRTLSHLIRPRSLLFSQPSDFDRACKNGHRSWRLQSLRLELMIRLRLLAAVAGRRDTASLWPLLTRRPLRAPRPRRRGRSHCAGAPTPTPPLATGSPRPPLLHPARAGVVGLLSCTSCFSARATPSSMTPPRRSCAALTS